MYAFIRGKLIQANLSHAIVDVGGVGYKVFIPLSTFSKLPSIGMEVFLHTSFVVRELFQGLYGFLEEVECELFEVLINLSGIGPKTALGIIGHLSVNELEEAVSTNNLFLLSKVPGIGKKTAERLIVDLRGKVHKSIQKEVPSFQGKMHDALQALIHLGYNQNAAESLLLKASELVGSESDLSTLISQALKLQTQSTQK